MQKNIKKIFLTSLFMSASLCVAMNSAQWETDDEDEELFLAQCESIKAFSVSNSTKYPVLDQAVINFSPNEGALVEREDEAKWGLDVFEVEGCWQEWYEDGHDWLETTDTRLQGVYFDLYMPMLGFLSIVNKCVKRLTHYADRSAWVAYAQLVDFRYPRQGLYLCTLASYDLSDNKHNTEMQSKIKDARAKVSQIIAAIPVELQEIISLIQSEDFHSASVVSFVTKLFDFFEEHVVQILAARKERGSLAAVFIPNVLAYDKNDVALDLCVSFEELLLRIVGLANSIKAMVADDLDALSEIDFCMQKRTTELTRRLARIFQPGFEDEVKAPANEAGSLALSIHASGAQATSGPTQQLKSCIPNIHNRKAKQTVRFV